MMDQTQLLEQETLEDIPRQKEIQVEQEILDQDLMVAVVVVLVVMAVLLLTIEVVTAVMDPLLQ